MAEQSVYAPPGANVAEATQDREYPGLRRLPYFGWGLALQVAFVVLTIVVGPGAISLLFSVAMLGGVIYLLVLRLQNLGSSGWWTLAMFVPLLNFYIGLKAMAFPEGYDDHKQLDQPAKNIIGLFVGFFVLTLAGVMLAVMGN